MNSTRPFRGSWATLFVVMVVFAGSCGPRRPPVGGGVPAVALEHVALDIPQAFRVPGESRVCVRVGQVAVDAVRVRYRQWVSGPAQHTIGEGADALPDFEMEGEFTVRVCASPGALCILEFQFPPSPPGRPPREILAVEEANGTERALARGRRIVLPAEIAEDRSLLHLVIEQMLEPGLSGCAAAVLRESVGRDDIGLSVASVLFPLAMGKERGSSHAHCVLLYDASSTIVRSAGAAAGVRIEDDVVSYGLFMLAVKARIPIAEHVRVGVVGPAPNVPASIAVARPELKLEHSQRLHRAAMGDAAAAEAVVADWRAQSDLRYRGLIGHVAILTGRRAVVGPILEDCARIAQELALEGHDRSAERGPRRELLNAVRHGLREMGWRCEGDRFSDVDLSTAD